MTPPLPPHGKANWEGTLDLPPISESRSLLTGEKLIPVVTVGSVLLPQCEQSYGATVGRGGMVYDIGHDENGEAVLHVLNTRMERNKTRAWTWSCLASEIDPLYVVPDSPTARHGYACGALRAAADGRHISVESRRLVGIGMALVADCIWGAA